MLGVRRKPGQMVANLKAECSSMILLLSSPTSGFPLIWVNTLPYSVAPPWVAVSFQQIHLNGMPRNRVLICSAEDWGPAMHPAACVPHPGVSLHTVLTEFCLDSYWGGPGIQGVDCPGTSNPFIRTHSGFSCQHHPPGCLANYFCIRCPGTGPPYPASCPPDFSPATAAVVWEARQPLGGQVCAPRTYRVISHEELISYGDKTLMGSGACQINSSPFSSQ